MKKALLLFLMGAVPALVMAQTDLVYPWVTNNAQFRGRIIINNLNNQQVEVTLNATRPAGSDPQTANTVLMLEAFEQRVVTIADLFPGLGDGPAMMIRLTSDASNIQGGFVNVGTQSSTGTSPSQANVFQMSEAANILLFNYMFIDDPAGFSAPVVINTGDTAADVTFYTYQNGQLVGDPIVQQIEAGTPFAGLAANLSPAGTAGDIMMVAQSDNALLGTVFIFNELLEPSMANAVPIDAVPDPGGNEAVVYEGVVEAIFTATCGGGTCHVGGPAQGGLALDQGVGYGEMVNVPSTQNGSLMRILPGDADNSYVYRKLLSSADAVYSGSRMPRGRAPLSDSDLALIRQWIQDGAIEK
ncbi:MAG: hypothetical protein QNK37_14670 [Acidobacteriota bacterium]|nr:hypothetical protein [Acidobacteriota bacterium]